MFNPTVGILARALNGIGYEWNHYLNNVDGFILMVIAAAWKRIGYNCLFFPTGLRAIPRALILYLGGSTAQSIIPMIVVVDLTMARFKYIE